MSPGINSNIRFSVQKASSDGLYWPNYPQGNRPSQLFGGASVAAAVAASLATGIRLRGAATVVASAAAIFTGTLPAVAGVVATSGDRGAAIQWTINGAFTSYNVSRSTTSGSGYTIVGNVVTGSPTVQGYFDDAGGVLTNGVTYYYVVQGVTSGSATGPQSAQVSVVPATNALQPAPNGVNGQGLLTLQTTQTGTNIEDANFTLGQTVYVRAAQQNPSTFAVTFSTSGGNLTGCKAAWSGIALTGNGIPTTDFQNFTIIDDQTASFTLPNDAQSGQVYLGNGSNTGFAAAGLVVQYTTVPDTPTGLIAISDAAGSAADLSWNNSFGAQSFKLYRSTTNGSGYTLIASPGTNSYVDPGLTNGTTYYYVVKATNNIGDSGQSSQASVTPAAPPTGAVTITVSPGSTSTISKYVYGLDLNATLLSPGIPAWPYANCTIDRLGGNRFTAANWQNGYSSSGADLNPIEIDQYLTSNTAPLHMLSDQFDTDRTNGLACVMTVQVQGYVAAIQSGGGLALNTTQAAGPGGSFPTLWKSVVFAKGSAFTATPSNSNASVYMDEFVWALDQHYSGQGVFSASPSTFPIHIELDNEPDAWAFTHPEVQSATEIDAVSFINNSIACATAIKAQFPDCIIYGPVNASFASMFWWRGEDYPDAGWGATNFSWFFDDYIAKTKGTAPKPKVDVLCYHWYSQQPDPVTGAGIGGGNSDTSLTTAQIQTIAQGSRSLYDPNFIESSYITQDVTGAWVSRNSSISGTTLTIGTLDSGTPAIGNLITGTSIRDNTTISGKISSGGGSGSQWTVSISQNVGSGPIQGGPTTASINMVPLINSKIAHASSPMKQGITEWFMGGNQHIAGTLVHADCLGAFGANGVFVTTMWPNGSPGTAPYAVAALACFRNFDGAGSNFGETAVVAASSQLADVSVWASTSTTHTGRVVLVIVNRSVAPQDVTVNGITLTGTARLWRITASSALTQKNANQQIVPVSAGTQSVSGSSAVFAAVPGYSVTTVDIY